jgi:hypothetical protein
MRSLRIAQCSVIHCCVVLCCVVLCCVVLCCFVLCGMVSFTFYQVPVIKDVYQYSINTINNNKYKIGQ